MTEYLAWRNKINYLSEIVDFADRTEINKISANQVVRLDHENILYKIISPERPYIPRIKALGEVAYALFDHLLNLDPSSVVTPYVHATSPNMVWREYIPGTLGEDWRGLLYLEKGNLESADMIIVDKILNSESAQRIALLDLIFLCQDRSGRNWLIDDQGKFWAFDSNMLWPYKGRFADKRTIATGEVDHLTNPMDALMFRSHKFSFQNGVFSSLWAGKVIGDVLIDALVDFDWAQYLGTLEELVCEPLGYLDDLMIDWRFCQLVERIWILVVKGRFPTASELYSDEWGATIIKPDNTTEAWRPEWETENLETS